MATPRFGLASSNEAARIAHCFFWLSNAIDNPLPLIDIEANKERPNQISDELKAD